MDADYRRLELLKLEGLGFSQAEIVKELSVKCACSERAVYSDFESEVLLTVAGVPMHFYRKPKRIESLKKY